ncbi:hypothetical protein CDAR_94521 [Caerostris darwini]|uniref:Uncharacterized protein n=1 Tax=Caerostris darwini TaxID=1538125 RepID=A0AAV4NGA1_9ARAC|nr:hypothetical protein CDAR_94521 [Caerostris darwini]
MAEEGGTSKFEVTQAKTPDDSTLSPMSPTSYTLSDNDRTTDRLLPGGNYQNDPFLRQQTILTPYHLKYSHRKYQISVNHLSMGTMQKVHPTQSIDKHNICPNDCERTILNGLESTMPHVIPHICWNIDMYCNGRFPMQIHNKCSGLFFNASNISSVMEARVDPDLFILR